MRRAVLRIPLPKEEVKSLSYWGMKPGFVMQRVGGADAAIR
jgi:hypothetical protein